MSKESEFIWPLKPAEFTLFLMNNAGRPIISRVTNEIVKIRTHNELDIQYLLIYSYLLTFFSQSGIQVKQSTRLKEWTRLRLSDESFRDIPVKPIEKIQQAFALLEAVATQYKI